jgi:hypothetical protein
MNKRSFTILLEGKTIGKYVSTTPSGAAKKAFTRLCRDMKKKSNCKFQLTIKETTKNSKHKTFTYEASRKKISGDGKIINLGGKPVIIKYTTDIKSVKKDEMIKDLIKQKLKKRKLNFKKKGKKMQKGAGKGEDDEGIYTGYYNIFVDSKLLHTDYFMVEYYMPDEDVLYNIMQKHTDDFIAEGIKGNISIEVFDIEFYPREEGPDAIEEVLQVQLEGVQESMYKMNQDELKKRKANAFDMTDIFNALLDL